MSDPENFWAKVPKISDKLCWPWKGYINPDGYGRIQWDGRTQNAHRISWIIQKGTIPQGLQVLHKCDNPPCVNLEHLFLGTHNDNIADKMKKGRHHEQKKTLCKRGHPFDKIDGRQRKCRKCQALKARERYAAR